MRRDLVIVIVLLVAAVGGLVWAHGEIKQAETDIRISETIIQGDPSVAEGLEVTMNSKLEDTLYWSTIFWPGTDRKPESTFDFRDDYEVNMDRVTSPYDVFVKMSTLEDSITQNWPVNIEREYKQNLYFNEMILPVVDLASQTAVADAKTAVVSLSEYYDYYPLSVNLSAGTYMQHDADLGELLTEVFRIPVPKEHKVEVTVTRDEEGEVTFEMKPTQGAVSVGQLTCSYELGEDGFYILVHNQWLDCSEFADGYGIYKIPVKRGELSSQLQIDEIYNFYSIDPEKVRVVGMDVDEKGESLLLYTRQNETLCLTMIPLDSSGEEYTIILSEYGDYGDILEMYFGKGYIVLQLEEGITLITAETQWTTPWNITKKEDLMLDPSFTVMEEKDGKLVIVTTQRPEHWDRIAYVSILDETGVLFEAEYSVEGDSVDTKEYDRNVDVLYQGSRYDDLNLQNKTPFTVNW